MATILTILILATVIFWILRRTKLLSVCPICAAVSISWTVGIILIYTNNSNVKPAFLAALMGATLGALAEKYSAKFGPFWKTTFVILGLPAIYFLVYQEILESLILLVLLAAVTFLFSSFRLRPPPNSGAVDETKVAAQKPEEKEDKFKDCCD